MVEQESLFVGREKELAELGGALDALGMGMCAGVVQIVGEAGIGKSRLVEEVCELAVKRDHLVLTGRAAEFERELPFGLFAAALDDYLSSLETLALEGLEPELAPELATAFPVFVPLATGRAPVVHTERYRTYRAVRALLEVLARTRPLVVALDDVHWADPASVELLSYLLAHEPRAPVLLVVAFRPAQVAPPLARALAAAARERRAQRLELTPLSRVDVEPLMPEALAPAVRDYLYRDSGGNPFYLEQLVRGVTTETVQPSGGHGRAGVPPAVAAALATELVELPDDVRTVLQAGAVVGDPFTVDLAAAVAERDVREALAALDQLVELDLLRPAPVPCQFRFRHPIVRRAVYESAGVGWRIGAHARTAAALRVQGVAVSVRAHHVERSAEVANDEAIAVLTEAGHATAARAPAAAAHWYGAALRLLGADDPRTVDLLVAGASALSAAGQLEESQLALCRALERLPPGAEELRLRLTTSCARVETLLGRHRQAHSRLVRALSGLGDPASEAAAALKLELSYAACYASDFAGMLSWAEKALPARQRMDRQPLRAAASAAVALAKCLLGRIEDAAIQHAEAAALFDELDDDDLARRLDAACYLGWAEVFLERFGDALRHLERGIAVSRQTGQGHLLVPMLAAETRALSLGGRLRQASDVATAAVETARYPGYTQLLSWALWERCMVAICSGEVATAIEAGEEAVELARAVDTGLLAVSAGEYLAMALFDAGQVERARNELLAATGGTDLPLVSRPGRCVSYEVLTRIELALGRQEAADGWATRAERAAQGLDLLPVATGAARRARAAVLLSEGKAQEAARLALEAALGAAHAGAPVEAGRSRILAGRALAKAGDRTGAIAELERAEAELDHTGANGYRDEAARELRRLGKRRSRRPEAQGLQSLSEREREIADLVAAGHTNAEIAAVCYLSIKTVERHISNAFVKLGVTSRAGLANVVAVQR